MTHKSCFIVCTVLVAYLAGDFFVFNGPLNRAIQVLGPGSARSIAKDKEKGVIARVHERPISASQLDRATREHLWLSGKTPAAVTLEEQQAARKAALDGLIAHELVRARIGAMEKEIEVPAAEIDAAVKEFSARFASPEELDAACASQGISSAKDLRGRLAARLREEKYVLSQVTVAVTPEEAEKWYAEHQQALGIPERVEARHIFIPTLSTPAEQAKEKLDAALAALTAKQKDFPTLAKELSEDPATKESGGNLGWMSRRRLSPDFAEPVFSLGVNQPTLVRTRLGWHLIEVTGRKPAEPRSFADAKAEIITALEAVKRRAAVAAFREKLLADGSVEIRIYDETLQ